MIHYSNATQEASLFMQTACKTIEYCNFPICRKLADAVVQPLHAKHKYNLQSFIQLAIHHDVIIKFQY